MRAFPVDDTDLDSFREVELPTPEPGDRDLLVAVEAVSINPVDTKVRRHRAGRVLGWDAAGTVVAVGSGASRFRVGERVYYAGDITRSGCNAERHLVDERLVARAPKSLDSSHAAAIPLSALTAWEGLYELLQVKPGRTLLVINGAGGVGSMVVQLAKQRSQLTVIGTASRPESAAWVREIGADHTVDHRGDLPAQVRALGVPAVDYIFCCHSTDRHFDAMAELIAPQGRIVSIVETDTPLPLGRLFARCVSFSWEFMFAKSMHQTADQESQGTILSQVADLFDEGILRSTLREDAALLDANALAAAHRRQEAGALIGKQVLRFA